jgi:hypothetical protein
MILAYLVATIGVLLLGFAPLGIPGIVMGGAAGLSVVLAVNVAYRAGRDAANHRLD